VAAPSAPTAPRFSPVERPRAAIATDGTLAAIVESQRVVVLELPGGEPFAEVGVDPAAIANEVAWVGAPPRLCVLSRYTEHSRIHLVDPHGPRALADLRLETPMRLAATCGAHALLVSPQSAVIITATDDLLVSVPYPARAVPAIAGVAGTNFLVAHADSVEEWDPHARMPKRRLKLPRTATITTLGGSDRVVWMTTQQEPSRLDVLALVDRGQPKAHDLPEPIALATGHPRSDLVVCIGESGKVYVVDLDGRSKLKTIAIDGIDKAEAAGLVVGRIVGVLAAQTERPVAIHTLEGHAPEPEAAAHVAPAASATSKPTPPGRTTAPASSPIGVSGANAPKTTSSSVVSPMPTPDAPPGERKKPPPPPPGRSGTTVPPPIAAAAHASVPSAPSSSAATGSHAALPTPASTKPSGPVPSISSVTASQSTGTASVSPSASSLARPATRAFARAPTPHPRATSEGVDVDLDGVFDELSSEAKPNSAPSHEPSEQFDSPLAFEARPVSDHRAPTEGALDGRKPKLTDPRPVPPAVDRRPPSVEKAPAVASKVESAEKAKVEAKSSNASELGSTPTTEHDSASTSSLESASTSASASEPKPGPNPPMPSDDATSGIQPALESTSVPSSSASGMLDDDDDYQDLAPPREPASRDATPRESAPRESGPMRAPIRESQLSLRDAPVRKPRREVTVRQGAALPAPKPAWRDEVVFWTYEVFDGVVERGAPIASPLDDLASRFAIPESVLPSLVLLYGAHLAGERGVAPVHVARVLGSWDEALGRGLLAGRGLATFTESRVRLGAPIQRFLDEVAVETGALVGVPGNIALPGPHAVIAQVGTPLKMVAVRWLAQVGGAILAAHDDADLGELFVEARARGAAPMFRIGADELLELGTDPAILVVTDEEVAESLGVPRLA
jgi:hypothetical protein